LFITLVHSLAQHFNADRQAMKNRNIFARFSRHGDVIFSSSYKIYKTTFVVKGIPLLCALFIQLRDTDSKQLRPQPYEEHLRNAAFRLLLPKVPQFAKDIETKQAQMIIGAAVRPCLRELHVSAANSVRHWKDECRPTTSQPRVTFLHINNRPVHIVH
jgi:hypothetical protein